MTISSADLETHGVRFISRPCLVSKLASKVVNRQSRHHPAFRVGLSENRGTRRTMEDAHSFVVDFDSVRGQGFFAVFDGHAGKYAAEWCGSHFHKACIAHQSGLLNNLLSKSLLSTLHESPMSLIPDVLEKTFHKVDESLSHICEESDGKIHSGCTAVTAFLRVEDADGRQSFRKYEPTLSPSPTLKDEKLNGSEARIPIDVIIPPADARRVLYVANAGDARGVLCRDGQAVRLTYDHKGSDRQEAKRIMDAGGFVMSGRVNGVLAVTRSLGDPSMKEFVVGAPYTTKTVLGEQDEFLVLACDGVSARLI